MKTKISAVHVPHNKNTAAMNSVPVAAPAEVILPMNMHGGAPAVPVVAVGDYVRIGQMIAKEEGRNPKFPKKPFFRLSLRRKEGRILKKSARNKGG